MERGPSNKNEPFEKDAWRLVHSNGLSDFMAASTDLEDWRARCEFVKKTYGGSYPKHWYEAIIAPNVFDAVESRWKRSKDSKE